jgi:Spy/CpxP family protein refolding chaperone
MKSLVFGISLSALAFSVFAGTESPYAGQEARDIKSLSQQEVEDYLNGRGMGYAKTAELNQYPGPRHVLDMAKELSLTEEQSKLSQKIFDAMKAEAMALGSQLVEKERQLDQMFAGGSIESAGLKSLLTEIATIQAKIRYVHLKAHLEQRPLLTKHQIMKYSHLRGYGNSHGSDHTHTH